MASRTPWNHSKTARQRGYGAEHQRLRKILLAQEPLCRPCQAKGRVREATIADHIIPIAKGGAIYDLSNMQPVCGDCHDAKTRKDNGWKAKPRFGTDGWTIDD